MKFFKLISLLFWTLRYLTFHQVLCRLLRIVRRKKDCFLNANHLARDNPDIRSLKTVYQGLYKINDRCLWEKECAIAEDILAQRFKFLSIKIDFKDKINWKDPSLSQLWLYNLHYFNYIIDLLIFARCVSRHKSYIAFKQLVLAWICDNDSIEGDGWHPYTISIRTVNWIEGFNFFRNEIDNDNEFRRIILRSLFRQAEILYRDREFDVRGNHLIANLRGLIWLGMFFAGNAPEKWFSTSLLLLESEVAEQVLADGGHFERSPGYHIVVMKDILEVGFFLRRNNKIVPDWMIHAIERMSKYLLLITTPRGKVPLLKDTAFDVVSSAGDVGAAAAVFLDRPDLKPHQDIKILTVLWLKNEESSKLNSWRSILPSSSAKLMKESGHFLARDNDSKHFLILDVGKVCPSYLPAHGQADMFTYELYIAGLPAIVDSGVYEYKAGQWRDYFRSTRAHNTVEVNGRNQSEMWSSFRVAKRARIIEVKTGGFKGVKWCGACHDGYRGLKNGGDHFRLIVWIQPDIWIVFDEIVGSQGVRYENNIHFFPGSVLKLIEGSHFKVNLASNEMKISGFGNCDVQCAHGSLYGKPQGWYSEEFGILQKNSVLTFKGEANGGQPFGYMIFLGEIVPKIEVNRTAAGWTADITVGTESMRLLKNEAEISLNRF